MKKQLLIAIIIIFSSSAYSQFYIGARVGLNMSTTSVMPSLINYTQVSQFVPKLGLSSGLVFKYRFLDAFAIQTEINYNRKGLKAKIDEMYEDTALTGSWNYSFDYIEVPLMFKYLIGKSRVGPFIEAGGYYGYLFSAKYTEYAEYGDRVILDNEHTLDEDYVDENDNEKTNRHEYGFKLGLGANFEVNNSILYVALRYTQGLTDFIEYRTKPDDYDKTYNRVFQISAGYLFELGGNDDNKVYYY